MALDALDLASQLIPLLRPLVAKIARHDRHLATQLRNAGNSVTLNLEEGVARRGADGRHLLSISYGSARESSRCLRNAVGWGYLEPDEPAAAEAVLDRLRATVFRLRG